MFEHESRVRSVSLTAIQNATPDCREAKIKARHVDAFAGVALGDPMARVAGVIGPSVTSQKTQINGHDAVLNSYRIAGRMQHAFSNKASWLS